MIVNSSLSGSVSNSRCYHHLTPFQIAAISAAMMHDGFRGAGRGKLYPTPMLPLHENIPIAGDTILPCIPLVDPHRLVNNQQGQLEDTISRPYNSRILKSKEILTVDSITPTKKYEIDIPPPAESTIPTTIAYKLDEEKNCSSKKQTTERSLISKIHSSKSTGGGRLYIDAIREEDILCGRGGRSNHHYGNKKYREVINEMKMKYKMVERKLAKTDLSTAIVEYVYNYGGRFIKEDEKNHGKYYLLTPAEARRKTSQALRENKDIKWMT